MEKRAIDVSAKMDSSIKISIVPGHFATNHSHVNYYVDISSIKTQHKAAKKAAFILASKFRFVKIDTIICLEGTEVVGAFIADELTQSGPADMNSGDDISIIKPELNSNNQMIFVDSAQSKVWGKRVLLLLSSASTGKSITHALECLDYYNGELAGVSALFSAVSAIDGIEINSVFTESDLPVYETYTPGECKMCIAKQKIDAIVNSSGYSKL